MEHKWFAFVFFVWIVGMWLGATYEKADIGTYDPAGEGMGTTISYVMNARNIMYTTSATGSWTFVGVNPDYFEKIWQVLTFDFAFMSGPLEMVRWILLFPLSIAVVFGLIQLFVTIIQGIFSAITP